VSSRLRTTTISAVPAAASDPARAEEAEEDGSTRNSEGRHALDLRRLEELLVLLREADGLGGLVPGAGAGGAGARGPMALNAAIRQLPQSTVSEGSVLVDRACSVCCSNFAAAETIRTLPCMHIYHATCIDGWLVQQPLCPECKFDITAEVDIGAL
jgi:hypothetical protein